MESFSSYVKGFRVPEGKTAVFWLGQAGFVFKNSEGDLIALDPYLSDCCNRYFGFKRMIPYLMTPYDIEFDAVLCSHAHFDHFDPDSVPQLLANGRTRLVAAMDCRAECERLNIHDNAEFIKVGDTVKVGRFTVTAVPCDHGEGTPDALGFLIKDGDRTVYSMGDTCLRTDYLENEELHGLSLLILPINGAYGNLNETEAVTVCKALTPKLAVPCHFGNFARHGGNPYLFMENMKESAPDIAYNVMRVGEGILI